VADDVVFDIEAVSFTYEDKNLALDDVCLSVQRGERLAILGSNGSGKSTLLKLLDGLYFPTRGVVKAWGQPLTERAFDEEAFNFSFRRRVGLVFQDAEVQLFSPSVWDEVAFAPLQMGLPRDEVAERVEAALTALRIDKLRDRAPHRLSGGEKRRVALASVLTLRPEVWLLDEPTTGLDPRSKLDVQRFVAELRDTHDATILLTTHDMDEADALCDRIAIIDGGRIVADGEPNELKAAVAVKLGLDRPATLTEVFMAYTGRDWEAEEPEGDEDGE
jgi:cobalt/nickel transport system ATP-binding protein